MAVVSLSSDSFGNDRNPSLIFFLQEDPSNYGIDWQGPIPEQHPDSVEVPDTNCPFTEDELNLLPNTYDMNYLAGVDAFTHIKTMLSADTYEWVLTTYFQSEIHIKKEHL